MAVYLHFDPHNFFVFFVYDVMVKRRQNKVMERIIRQDKIVLNTFPKAIRDQLYRDSSNDDQRSRGSQSYSSVFNNSDNNINAIFIHDKLINEKR